MRLTDYQIDRILSIARGIYGDAVRIYLFGSRINDEKRGGDIDLLIETDDFQLTTLDNKIKYLSRLKLAIGDQKIDLVYLKNLDSRPGFSDTVLKTRIRLC